MMPANWGYGRRHNANSRGAAARFHPSGDVQFDTLAQDDTASECVH